VAPSKFCVNAGNSAFLSSSLTPRFAILLFITIHTTPP
jgi:hypothetical protein